MTTNPQRLLAYALIALGVFLLLLRLGGADWLWLALLGVIFLFAYTSRRLYGFLVAGGVLTGLAVGTLLDSGGGMLLSLAAGFYAVDRVEPKPNRWALYTAGVLAALGVFVALGSFRLLDSVFFALVLVGVGVYLLYRGEGTARPTAEVGSSSDSSSTYGGPPTPPTPQAPATPEPIRPAPVAPIPVTPAAPTLDAPTNTPNPEVRISDVPREPLSTPATTPLAEEPQPVTPPPPPAPLSEAAQERLGRLSAWRKETAATEGTPAYIVFTNDTLAKIAVAEPRTLEDLGGIRGVGPVKLSRYGEAVLRILHGGAA